MFYKKICFGFGFNKSVSTTPVPVFRIRIQINSNYLKEEKIQFLFKKAIFLFFILIPQRSPFKLQEKPPAPPNRTSNTSKHEISSLLCGSSFFFAFLDPDPDPDAKHCTALSTVPTY
jgi:hypothetical protein